MATHAQVVVAAPHRHAPHPIGSLGVGRLGVMVCHGEGGGVPVHRLEHPVRVVPLLDVNLVLKEAVVAEEASWRVGVSR